MIVPPPVLQPIRFEALAHVPGVFEADQGVDVNVVAMWDVAMCGQAHYLYGSAPAP